MRILLISMYDDWRLGLRSLASVLKRQGHEVSQVCLYGYKDLMIEAGLVSRKGLGGAIASLTEADLQALADLTRRLNPGLIGLSVTGIVAGVARRVTQTLKAASKAPVIWGGIDPTANPDLDIQIADMVCIGEGEGAMADLAERLAAGRDYGDVANLWIRRPAQGGAGEEIIRNNVRPLIQDLDRLPFSDYSLDGVYCISNGETQVGALPAGSDIKQVYPVISGRGCPYSCSYCGNSLLRGLYGAEGYVRFRSPGNVVEEIAAQRRSNPDLRFVMFADEVFAVRMEWLKEFAPLYRARIGLPFSAEVFPTLANAERIQLLKDTGMSVVSMGIQSGSPRVLRELYNRNVTREQILEGARVIREASVELVVDIIGDNPLESDEDCAQTLELLLQLPPGFILHYIYPLAVFRNFPIEACARESGLFHPWNDERHYSYAIPRPELTFWRSLFLLAQFPNPDREHIRQWSRDAWLRAHPDVLDEMAWALLEATYLPFAAMRYADEMRKAQSELASLRGSRLVRLALRIRDILHGGGKS
ncbi:MAG: radical SAM protein [Candidatus Sumerlaeota bacterium]|nr:radical SAM protein [Candidatus Sumerlaeota bacterium]